MSYTVVYEAVAPVTLTRGDQRVSLVRGARLKIGPERHGFAERELQRAIRDGKLRRLPLGAEVA